MPAALLLLVFFQAYLDRKSYLELSKGDTTTSADATVVLDGRAADAGPQLVHRTGSDLGSLCLATKTWLHPARKTSPMPLGMTKKKHKKFASQAKKIQEIDSSGYL